MTRKSPRRRRTLLCAVLIPTLLTTSPCIEIPRDALIEGFFDAWTPYLLDEAEDRLGLQPDETTTTET